MDELNIQIKVLKQGTPVFFTWRIKDSNTIEGYLVSCPCQNLDLIDGSSLKMKKAELAKGCTEISHMNLAKALQVAEIVTLSKGVESRSSLGRENHLKRSYEKVERGRKMSQDGDGENEVVDEYRFNGGGQESGGGGSLECGGGDLEDDGGVLEHDERGIECGDGGKLEDGGGGSKGDGDAEDVGSMSSYDGSDFETDQINREDVGEDRGREDLKRKFKVNVKSKENSDNGGTHFEESIETSDLCKESETVNCEQTDGTRQRGEVNIKDKESFCDDIQQDKDLLQGGNKRDNMTVTQSDSCEQVENYKGNHLRDRSDVRPAGMSVRDSVTESDITPNIEEGGDSVTESDITPNIEEGSVAKIKGGTDGQETGDDPVSDDIKTVPDSENGQMVTNSLQVQQRDLITQAMDISSLSADSVVVLDESNEVDSALFKALEGIMGAQLSGNENEVSRCERLSEPSQTLAKVSSGSCSDSLPKPDPALVVNTPAMIKYRKHKNEEYLKRLHKFYNKSASECVICEYCGAILKSKNLANHIAAYHAIDTREKRFQCEVCGNTHLRHEDLQRHMSTHTGAEVFCGQRGEIFQHEYSLKAHEKTHWEVPPSLPVQKPKYRAQDPKIHWPSDNTKSETDQQQGDPVVCRSKQVSCQVCGKRVSCKSLCRHLRMVHKVISQASRPHGEKFSGETCTICGKTVSRKSMKRHLRIHLKSGPKICWPSDETKSETSQQQGEPVVRRSKQVSCQICGKRVSCKSLCRHLRMVHKAISQVGRPHSEKFSGQTCAMCGKTVSRKSMKRHLRIHSKSGPKIRWPSDKAKSETSQQQGEPVVRRSKQVSCQVCGKRVSCKSLSRHLRTVHKATNQAGRSGGEKSREETCTTCGKTISRRSMKRHQCIHSESGPRQEIKANADEAVASTSPPAPI